MDKNILKNLCNAHSIDENRAYLITQKNKIEVIKSDNSDVLHICGYLSTFGNIDRTGDVVNPDAFSETLKEIKQLPMMIDHSDSVLDQVGTWNTFKVDKKGLFVDGFITKTDKTEHIIKLIETGALNTVSMRGLARIELGDNGTGIIEKMILLEGSLVSIPANPQAKIKIKPEKAEKSTGLSSEKPAKLSHGEKLADLKRIIKKIGA